MENAKCPNCGWEAPIEGVVVVCQFGNHRVSPADVLVRNEGTLFLFRPVTDAARGWIDDNVQDDARWLGPSLVVEHRYAGDLAGGMKAGGLVLADL